MKLKPTHISARPHHQPTPASRKRPSSHSTIPGTPAHHIHVPPTGCRICCHSQNICALCPMATPSRPRDNSLPSSPPTHQTPTVSRLDHSAQAKLDSTQHQPSKTACRQIRGRKTGTPRCLDVKSGSRQAEAAGQRGCVLFKLFEASQPCRTTTAFLCSISNFCVPKARRQQPVHSNCLADRVGRKQSSAVRRQLHSGIVSQYSGIHPIS